MSKFQTASTKWKSGWPTQILGKSGHIHNQLTISIDTKLAPVNTAKRYRRSVINVRARTKKQPIETAVKAKNASCRARLEACEKNKPHGTNTTPTILRKAVVARYVAADSSSGSDNLHPSYLSTFCSMAPKIECPALSFISMRTVSPKRRKGVFGSPLSMVSIMRSSAMQE